MMGAATEKAHFHRFSLVLGIESCCEHPSNSLQKFTEGVCITSLLYSTELVSCKCYHHKYDGSPFVM